MTAAALTPPRAPKPTENTAGSFLLAVAMHALLVLALWIGVQWRTQPQGEVTAELWGALPPPAEVAPPPPPPPPVVERREPEQPNADIVLQQEKKKRLEEEKRREEEQKQREAEQKKREAEQKKREAEQKKLEEAARKAAEEKRAAAQREAIRKAEEQRMLAQAGAAAPAAAGAAAAGGGRGDPSYAAQLRSLIRPRIVYAVPDGTAPKIFATVQVDLLPTGEIAAVKVLKPSGLPGYDAAVERAIWRTNPFPRKRDGTIDRTITIDFYPVDAQ